MTLSETKSTLHVRVGAEYQLIEAERRRLQALVPGHNFSTSDAVRSLLFRGAAK